ncbi:putative membrane protein [Bradyrhizobium sp. i1.3.1]
MSQILPYHGANGARANPKAGSPALRQIVNHLVYVPRQLIAESPRAPLRLLARLVPVLVGGLLCLWASPASADFRLCNNTSSRVGIALGYKDAEGWTTEGWWNISSRSCETLLRGTLVARYYYIYAIDYDRGGEWSGQAFMCSRDKEFTIRGTEDCLARGYDRTGYFEVDTGEQRAWTVQLTDANEQPSQQQRVPGLPGPVGPGGGRSGFAQ